MSWQRKSSLLLREVDMNCESSVSYPLDNSAIIHLASRRKNYTNGFRIIVTLKEPVCAEMLQKAVNCITLRFPAVIAGIRRGIFQYHIVPSKTPPRISKEQECLAPMSKDEIQNCAFRVLYSENRIVTEFFHSLTDGYGGMVVTNTLVAEYLHQKYSIRVPMAEMVLDTACCAAEEELIDDYFTYAGKKAITPKHRNVYQLPGKQLFTHSVLTTTESYPTDTILNAAHYYGVSVTTFLTAIMTASVMDIQKQHLAGGRHKKPIQIMVPVNLRRLFPSRTLRNFSLFALSCVEPQNENISFEGLLDSIGSQLALQNTKDYMAAAMAMNTRAERFPLYLVMPLPLKWLILRLTHQLFGENNSCISLSNIGVISLPEAMHDFIEGIDVMLTPRIRSPYNCGIVSFNGIMSISFSRICPEPELEKIFIEKLKQVIEITVPIRKGDV